MILRQAQILPHAVEQIAHLAGVLGLQGIEWSTNWCDWAAHGQTVYALPPGTPMTEENIRKHGRVVHRENEKLVLPRLTSDFAYAVALHELGHCAVGVHEAHAWAWAHQVALYWTPLMLRTAARAMMTYSITQPEDYPRDKVVTFLRKLQPFNVDARMACYIVEVE